MSEIYPQWWNTTITVFNKYTDPVTEKVSWFKYTIQGCFWKYVGDKVTVGNTVLETNNIICRIPENPAYLENYQWVALPNDQMSDYFTLSQGDIIIKGVVDENIDEYTKGSRSTDIIAKYKGLQGCMEVETWAINVGGGRNNPHYYVKGI